MGDGVGRPAHPYTTPRAVNLCSRSTHPAGLGAMQGNLVPVTSSSLVYLADYRPGWVAWTWHRKGHSDVEAGNKTTNITDDLDYRHEEKIW